MKTVLIILEVLASLGLIASILMQSGKSAGISGAIAGGAETFLGKKKGLDKFFNKLTTIFACVFLGLTLLLSVMFYS